MINNEKILVISPSWVGDLVMSQSLLELIKKKNPNCSIDVFASAHLHPLLERMAEVDNCLVSPFTHGDLKLVERFKVGKSLRNIYDHAYVLPNTLKSALVPFFAKIPIRTGWLGEQRYFLLNDVRFLDKEKLPLMVEQLVTLGNKKNEPLQKPLPFPKLQSSEDQLNKTLSRLKIDYKLTSRLAAGTKQWGDCQGGRGAALPPWTSTGLYPVRSQKNKPILAICPGAEYGPAKRWPASYFAEVANNKIKEGWEVWIFGGPKEQIIASEIQEKCNNVCVDFTGKTDLGEVVDLLSLAAVVVSNDSGLMHIAAALDRNLVAIYGSSSAGYTPPLLDSDKLKILSLDLSCSPCFKRECPLGHTNCLNNLKPDLVLDAIKGLFNQ